MDALQRKMHISPYVVIIQVVIAILMGEFAIMVAIEGVFTPLMGEVVAPHFWEYMDPLLLSVIVAPFLYFMVLRPMSAQQQKLEQQKDDLAIAAVTFNTRDGVIVTDEKHVIQKVNQSFTDITGYRGDEVIGKTPAVLQSGRQEQSFYRQMNEVLIRDKFWQGEIWNRRKDGEIYPEWLTITLVTNSTGKVYYVGIFSDITRRKSYEDKINFMAYHDKLTRLPSRELFYECLSKTMAKVRRKQDGLALFFLDLDGFKAINDTHGHEAGDEVLKLTSKRFLSCVRDEDTVARLGGDEFAIIMGGITSPSDVTRVAEKIIAKLSEPIALKAGVCAVGVSIGIARYPENGAELDKLMRAADGAMYESKAAGKNTYTLARIQAADHDAGEDWINLNEGHLLGFAEIDREHIELAETLSRLNDAIRSNSSVQISTLLLNVLVKQVGSHFRHEEKLMEQYGYEKSDAHRKEHQRLISELEYLKEGFHRGGELLALHTLKEWLLGHISDSDRDLCRFIIEKKRVLEI